MFGTLANKKILVLGFAFKANTNDTRESAAIQICKDLLEEGAELYIHDPKVSFQQVEIDLGIKQKIINDKNKIDPKTISEGNWFFVNNHLKAFENVDAVIILTEWKIYKEIDWNEVAIKMRKPGWVFDARSITEKDTLREAGLNVWRLGDGVLY